MECFLRQLVSLLLRLDLDWGFVDEFFELPLDFLDVALVDSLGFLPPGVEGGSGCFFGVVEFLGVVVVVLHLADAVPVPEAGIDFVAGVLPVPFAGDLALAVALLVLSFVYGELLQIHRLALLVPVHSSRAWPLLVPASLLG